MEIRTVHVALAAAVSLASGSMLTSQALAAPSKVKSGRTTLTLTNAGKKALKKHHIKLAVRKPGTVNGRSYRLPVKSGKYDFRSNKGSLTQRGSLQLRRGRRVVVVRTVKVTLSKKSKVVAKVNGRKITLAALKRTKQRVTSSGSQRKVERIQLRLTKAAAKRVNRKLGVHSFKKKSVFAKLSVRLKRPGAGGGNGNGVGGPGTSAAPDDTTSAAKIGLAPAVAGALAENGLDPSALPGADLLPDGTLSLPVAGVNIDPQTGTGTIDLSGGIQLGEDDNAITITDPQIVVNADTSGLYANVNGARVKLLDLDSSGLAEALQGGAKQLSDLLVSLSPEGADALNQAGGISLFVPGTPFGDISLTIPGS
jgi:hypothetical protein